MQNKDAAEPKFRFQFSMRFVLLSMGLLGVVLGIVAYVQTPVKRRITLEDVARIKAGMTERQVIRVLGAPLHRFETAQTLRWTLEDRTLQGFTFGDLYFLDVKFDPQGRVEAIEEVGRGRLRLMRPAPSGTPPFVPAK